LEIVHDAKVQKLKAGIID